ncbi:MAG: tyrosine-type recombinase/integrase [Acidobacteriota bacterium]
MASDRTGIARHGAGWRATVSQGRSQPKIRKAFPITATFREMQQWRRDEKARRHLTRKQRATRGTFAADAKRYLASVTALTTFKERARDIGLWIEVFGTKARDQITSAEIRAQRDRWLTEPRGKDRPPLSPHTVNLRLRALSNLWTVLDGPRADNPVREVDEAHEPDTGPRDLDYATIRKIFAEMLDIGSPKRGGTRPLHSLTKIRLQVLAYTGLPASQLMRLQPADVDLERGMVAVPSRRKGHGAGSALLPLLPPAIEAFRALASVDGFGPFSTSSMWKSFAIAARRAGVQGASPYSLRASFATLAYDVTEDDHLVMALLQHAALKTSHRYRQRALAKVLQRKTEKLGPHFGSTSTGVERTAPEKTGVFAELGSRVREALARHSRTK